MKAIVLRELGEPEKLLLEDYPDPEAGANEVVIRLKAAALNHRDVWIRTGRYAGITLPMILGSDGAGIVASVGSGVDSLLLGKEVVINPSINWGQNDKAQSSEHRILGLPDNGTYAQYVKVPAGNIVEKPPHLTFEETAAVPLASLTAYRALITRAKISTGETVLITGIGGGVATCALLIAVALGTKVLVSSGSDAKIEKAKSLGAADGVNYHGENWTRELLGLNNGIGPDVVIDSAGGDAFDKGIEVLKPGGRLVTFGATTGVVKELQVRRIFWKQLSILGSTMGTAKEFTDMISFYKHYQLKPVIDTVFPLVDTPVAHKRMESGDQFGKIVLTID